MDDPLADVTEATPDGFLAICHGFGCNFRTDIAFSKSDWAAIAKLMRAGRSSPVAERAALGKVMVWFDKRIGPEAQTTGHMARAGAGFGGDPHQFDCIDTTHNTMELLVILARSGLLMHHRFSEPANRFVGVPHETATIEETRTGARWSVDPWTHHYGEAPDILPIEVWRAQS